jgi:hypothetical protein
MPSASVLSSSLRALMAAGVLASLVAVGSAGASPPTAAHQSAAGCVPRLPGATPPPRLPPPPTTPKREKTQVRVVGGIPSCPSGQVPKIVPAKPNVPKGNPLIGPVRGSAATLLRVAQAAGEADHPGARPVREVLHASRWTQPGGTARRARPAAGLQRRTVVRLLLLLRLGGLPEDGPRRRPDDGYRAARI